MQLNTRQIFEITLTPTECETFSEIFNYMHKIHYLFDSPCFIPPEEEYDFPGFLLTPGRLEALIKTLAKLSLVLPIYGGIRQPSGLQTFLSGLRSLTYGYVKTDSNVLTRPLISV